MLKLYAIGCAIVWPLVPACFAASTTAAALERSQELLEQDKKLRQTIEREERFFVEIIVIKGTTKLSEQEIKEITAPFQRQWMSQKTLQQLIDTLDSAYRQKGIGPEEVKMSYRPKKDGIIEITVTERVNDLRAPIPK